MLNFLLVLLFKLFSNRLSSLLLINCQITKMKIAEFQSGAIGQRWGRQVAYKPAISWKFTDTDWHHAHATKRVAHGELSLMPFLPTNRHKIQSVLSWSYQASRAEFQGYWFFSLPGQYQGVSIKAFETPWDLLSGCI